MFPTVPGDGTFKRNVTSRLIKRTDPDSNTGSCWCSPPPEAYFGCSLSPAEPTQSQRKRHSGPQQQHQQTPALSPQRRTLENSGAQRVVQGGKREHLDE